MRSVSMVGVWLVLATHAPRALADDPQPEGDAAAEEESAARRGSDPELLYDAPRECPNLESVKRQIPATPSLHNTVEPRLIRIHIEKQAGGFVGRSVLDAVIDNPQEGEAAFDRQIAGTDCADVITALMLSLSLHLEDNTEEEEDFSTLETLETAEPTEPPVPRVPQKQSEGWAPDAELGFTARNGWSPSVDGAWHLAVGIMGLGQGLEGARLTVGPAVQFLDAEHVLETGSGTGTVSWSQRWAGARAQLCPYAVRWGGGLVGVLPCVTGLMANYHVDSAMVDRNDLAGAVDLSAEVQLRLEWFVLVLQGGASFPVDPLDIKLGGQTVFRQGPAAVASGSVHFLPFELFL